MTADLAGFLLAQLDADEAVARAATPGPWAMDQVGDHARVWMEEMPPYVPIALGELMPEDAKHIALHDPAFELDRIAWLRAVVGLHRASRITPGSPLICDECGGGAPCPTLLALAQPYRSRPGWRDEWTVGE